MVILFGYNGFYGLDRPMEKFVAVFAEKTRTLRGLGQDIAMKRAVMTTAVTNLCQDEKSNSWQFFLYGWRFSYVRLSLNLCGENMFLLVSSVFFSRCLKD